MAGKVKFDQDAAFKSIIGISEEEQIKGQENIETLENGKYMPSSEPKEEVTHGEDKKIKQEKQKKLSKNGKELGRPEVTDRETKIRISLAVLPSLYEDIKKISYVERKSASEIVSECMEQYVAENAAKLKEYNKIKKD